jgi:hypothetical protein
MPCYHFNGGVFCTRGRRAKPCVYCGAASSRLCDFPVIRKGKKATCDAALCDRCAQHGVSADVDFCRPHYKLALAAYNRRQAASRGAA